MQKKNFYIIIKKKYYIVIYIIHLNFFVKKFIVLVSITLSLSVKPVRMMGLYISMSAADENVYITLSLSVKPVRMMGLYISMSAADENVYMSYQHGFWMSDRLLLEARRVTGREQEF